MTGTDPDTIAGGDGDGDGDGDAMIWQPLDDGCRRPLFAPITTED